MNNQEAQAGFNPLAFFMQTYDRTLAHMTAACAAKDDFSPDSAVTDAWATAAAALDKIGFEVGHVRGMLNITAKAERPEVEVP
jgi:hypothetical protein